MKQKEQDKYTVERQLIEEEKKRKTKMKVRIETVNKETLIGFIYLDRAIYRRISDYLNDINVDFLILTDVMDVARGNEITYPFLAVNKSHVVLISES